MRIFLHYYTEYGTISPHMYLKRLILQTMDPDLIRSRDRKRAVKETLPYCCICPYKYTDYCIYTQDCSNNYSNVSHYPSIVYNKSLLHFAAGFERTPLQIKPLRCWVKSFQEQDGGGAEIKKRPQLARWGR